MTEQDRTGAELEGRMGDDAVPGAGDETGADAASGTEAVRRHFKLVIAYDGTDYVGWQVQKNGISVQQRVNEAVSDLFGEAIEVMGASRTDAGVHAEGNVASFFATTRMPADKIAYALNRRLPEDIAIQSSEEVDWDFHPRFDAVEKTYEYHIINRRQPRPLKRRQGWFFHRPLDVEAMRAATAPLIGEHDFRSFASIHAQTKTYVRTIYSLGVRSEEDEIIVRVTGSGFLYNMVRIIVGTLVQMGSGQKRPEDMARILAARDRKAAGPTAPARGLVLLEVVYE